MNKKTTPARKRGRPKKAESLNQDTRAALIRSGLEHFTEFGFVASGIDAILKNVGIPKGSFYYYFDSKEAFGLSVIQSYAKYFAKKLDTCLLDEAMSPLLRIANFVDIAKQGMVKYEYRRGCLVGNLGQEVDLLPDTFAPLLLEVFNEWQSKIADCLKLAQASGECNQHFNADEIAEFFWIGWEGAISRARLAKTTKPLDIYLSYFLKLVK